MRRPRPPRGCRAIKKKAPKNSLENVVNLEYLGTSVTNRIYVYEETERRLNSENPSYHSGSNFIDLPVKV
jgi:hypothetical protein